MSPTVRGRKRRSDRSSASALSVSAFARLVGVDEKAVRKAIASGRLKLSVGRNGRGQPVIADPELAQKEWTANAARPKRGASATSTLVGVQVGIGRERARQLKMANDVREGRLMSVETQKRVAFESARIIRENILNVPPRLAAELAAETDQTKVFALLDAELRKALGLAADQLAAAS